MENIGESLSCDSIDIKEEIYHYIKDIKEKDVFQNMENIGESLSCDSLDIKRTKTQLKKEETCHYTKDIKEEDVSQNMDDTREDFSCEYTDSKEDTYDYFVLLFGLTNLGKPISTIRKIYGDKNGDE